ncbi:MAG TPA: hypothetical protein VN709_02355 [Terriglobales bacterium]|nr:hypothetical protein [Terriglobales bacterium]
MPFSIWGCPHSHLSFPIVTHDQVTEPKLTKEQSHGERRPRPHVTCLDCGREFWYDWVRMRRLDERPQTAIPAVSPRRAA